MSATNVHDKASTRQCSACGGPHPRSAHDDVMLAATTAAACQLLGRDDARAWWSVVQILRARREAQKD